MDRKSYPFVPPNRERALALMIFWSDKIHERIIFLESLRGGPERNRERFVVREQLAGNIKI